MENLKKNKNKKIHILLSQVYCVWQVVKTPTITSNNTVYYCAEAHSILKKLITLHFHNKQAKSPLRTLRRHTEKWSFSSTSSLTSTSKAVYGSLCSGSCHGRFIPAKWAAPHMFTRRSEGLHCRCKQAGEEKRPPPALQIAKRFVGRADAA